MDIIRIPNNELNKTYFISDLHLGHANIIDYCNRPYYDVEDMNRELVDNWNRTVGRNRIFFLGDMSYGRGSRTPRYWLKQLTGRIHYIKGSHDRRIHTTSRINGVRIAYAAVLLAGGKQFFLIHNPGRVPSIWTSWVIHGHLHNTRPHLNGSRLINVSAEVVGYKPISMARILEEIK